MTTEVLALTPLSRDLRKAAQTLSDNEARYLVDSYYQMQSDRIRAENQLRSVTAPLPCPDCEEGSRLLPKDLAQAFQMPMPEDVVCKTCRDFGILPGAEPHDLFKWLSSNQGILEKRIQSALDSYSKGQELGRWARSVMGIGPVIAAGLLAHIDISKAETAGAIWSFAGLDPSREWYGTNSAAELIRAAFEAEDSETMAVVWLGKATNLKPTHMMALMGNEVPNREAVGNIVLSEYGDSLYQSFVKISESTPFYLDNTIKAWTEENNLDAACLWQGMYPSPQINKLGLRKYLSKRPWNASLKTLCWKIGESFVKVKSRDGDVYGKVYEEYRLYLEAKNERGDYADQTEGYLKAKNYSKTTESYKAYSQGKLPKAQIYARAKRRAVKLFLAHFHHVGYEILHGKQPPKPYVIEHLGHAHYISPPGWPM